MAEKVVITATGLISCIGSGKESHLNAFRERQSGVHYARHLRSKHIKTLLLGEVDRSNDELAVALGLPAGDNGYTRTSLLSMTAVGELLSGVDIALLKNERFAFINANTVGGMGKMEQLYIDLISDHTAPEVLKYIPTFDCSQSTEVTARHFGLEPFMATISTACSSSASALMMGARMIKQGIVRRAVCGGCDALSAFTVNGFYSLKNVDKSLSRPFDQNRNGLNIGEAAGYCLLESEAAAKERGAYVIAEFTGYANTNDAYHSTAPAPDGSGAHATMAKALAMAGLAPGEVAYINAHGTATQNNDLAEGRAIERLFGGKVPFSSTKPFTGHTLAAAGVIEAIFSLWAMEEGLIIPNLNFETRMEELAVSPATILLENQTLNHVLSNSFGFGGSNVSLVFSKP
ncbi:MAG: beta-ketoacyl-[acyl-carrier-protein] synthase family protein [Taibaiella sp.]|nr:beta-ketoacyl-[acyl-carrier-protein] synthase family protein [Taibaiella sp.]